MSIQSASLQLKSFWLPSSILALGIALLQYHSIQLWQGWTGWWSGLGWLVLLEMISLWLWFLAGNRWKQAGWQKTSTLHLLAGLTSAILLAGPLYQVGRPVIAELSSAYAAENEVHPPKAEIEEIRAGLIVYRRNSESRLGWQRKIDEAEEKLAEARQRLRSMQAKVAGFSWLRWGPLLLQGLSLVLFQIANIMAISHIAKNVSTPGNDEGNTWKILGNQNDLNAHFTDPSCSNGSPNSIVRALQTTLKAQKENGGISQSEFCRRHGLNPRDVSLLFHYFRNKADGKRNVSLQVLRHLKNRFLPNDGYEEPNAERRI